MTRKSVLRKKKKEHVVNKARAWKIKRFHSVCKVAVDS